MEQLRAAWGHGDTPAVFDTAGRAARRAVHLAVHLAVRRVVRRVVSARRRRRLMRGAAPNLEKPADPPEFSARWPIWGKQVRCRPPSLPHLPCPTRFPNPYSLSFTPRSPVLLLERADQPGFWQSVTGSTDAVDEPLAGTAARGGGRDGHRGQRACAHGLAPHHRIRDLSTVAPSLCPGVTRNTEHWFGLCVARPLEPKLAPREHLQWQWLPWEQAAERCFSRSNAEAVRQLARRVAPCGAA